LSLGQGDINGAQEAAAAAEALAGQLPPTAQTRCAVCHAHIALAKGDVEEAAHIADQLSADVDLHSLYRFARLTRARVLLAQGKKGAAWEELLTCAESAFRGGWGYALVAICVLQALAARTPAEAQLYLAQALKMAQPEGYLRTFMEAGEGLVPLLQEAARRGIEPEYVGRILAALAPKEQMAPAETSVLAEHLSGRELEVLRLVTAGLSNREIAGQLVISAGTAKTHIHNICGKLGVRNRTEAVARAKEIGLV
jgi:LuxR family maltose regulon positive regulatory protein